ncbi:2-amino-3-carboxymuconate-6-semialdehyde decarboxylase [Xylaria digitata]|nr:2-amino-3-carboxymuconate-6-semialdehyde decarboxylase [Xylaria digitata]
MLAKIIVFSAFALQLASGQNVLERAIGGGIRWLSKRSSTSRIDTHIHVLTLAYINALDENGGDPSGWPTPSWTLEECVRFCDTIGSSSVLSITAPGPAILGPTESGKKLARILNDEVWDICQQRPGRFGFFASLPDFNDIGGALEEIRHIFEVEKNANGVVVMTSYGEKLAGDDAFRPIWKELNEHSALVFLHPSHVTITPEKISGFLPQPVIDYPLATTRTAMSLILSGIMTEYTQMEVILSHAGGTFPILAQRGLGSLIESTIAQTSNATFVQAKSAASLLATTSSSNILYGSDFLYAPKLGIYAGLLQYSRFARTVEGRQISPAQLHGNAKRCYRSTRLHAPEFGLDDNAEAQEAREQLD